MFDYTDTLYIYDVCSHHWLGNKSRRIIDCLSWKFRKIFLGITLVRHPSWTREFLHSTHYIGIHGFVYWWFRYIITVRKTFDLSSLFMFYFVMKKKYTFISSCIQDEMNVYFFRVTVLCILYIFDIQFSTFVYQYNLFLI